MRPTTETPSFEQRFPYGWRYVKRVQPDGSETLEEVALTLEDVLHPKEGDVIPESKPHEADRRYLTSVFESRLASRPDALVTSDLLIHWGVKDMGDHSPDVAVFVGLDRPTDSVEGTLDLPAYGGRCELVVELVSPHTRGNDVVKKFEHYHRIGIPLYVIIDQEKEGGPRRLRAYRRKPDHYAEIESDDRYRIDLPLLGLILGLRDNRAVCYDLPTGEELGDYARIAREWEEAKRRLEEADRLHEEREKVMEEQVLARQQAQRTADEARREADRQRHEAERALKEADRQREEADRQREEADRQREEAERAKKEADRQRDEANRQRAAREEIENQKMKAEQEAAKLIQELQEKLRQLQAGTDPAGPTAS